MLPIQPQKIVVLTTPPTPREIAERFLKLPWHKRETILKSLGVVHFGTSETDRYIKAFRTLSAEGRIDSLVGEIQKSEKL